MSWLKRGFILLIFILLSNAVLAVCNLDGRFDVSYDSVRKLVEKNYPTASLEEIDIRTREVIASLEDKKEVKERIISEKPSIPSLPMLSIVPTVSWIGNWIGEKLGLIKTKSESYDEINLEDLIGKEISLDELQEGQGLPLLGEGGSSFVYEIEYKGKLYALKIFRKDLLDKERDINMGLVVRGMNGFVQYYAKINHEKDTVGILEEFVKAKSVRKLVDNNEVIDDRVVDNIISSLYNTINKAHEKGFIHGDLKEWNNVLIKDDGSVKIADYSWSEKKSEIFGFNRARLQELQELHFLTGNLITLKKSLKYVNDDHVWINEIKNVVNNYDDFISLLEQESKYTSKEFINDQLSRAKSNKEFILNKLRLLAEKQGIKNFDELVEKSREVNKIELKSFELSEKAKADINKIRELLRASYSEQDLDKASQNIKDSDALWIDIEDNIPREMSETIERDIEKARARVKEKTVEFPFKEGVGSPRRGFDVMNEVEALAKQGSLEDAVNLLTSNKAGVIEDDYINVKKWLLEQIIVEDAKSDNPEIDDILLGTNLQTNKREISLLYKRVNKNNVDKIFTKNLEEELGEGRFGTKAVVYVNIDPSTGEFSPHVVLLSESFNTHHSQALSELIDTEHKKLIYDGELDNSKVKQFLPLSFGYELLYDSKNEKILGIKMDSRITKAQINLKTKISRAIIEIANDALIDNIDNIILEDLFKKQGEIIKMPSGLVIS